MVEHILILTIVGPIIGLITSIAGATTEIIVSKNCIDLRTEADPRRCTQHADAEMITFYSGNDNILQQK